jgi:hypothetical protein
MPKTPKFIIDAKQPPRSMKHGKHRRTSPAAHGDTAKRTSPRDDRADAVTLTFAAFTNRLASISPPAPEIPYSGIRAGEITGRRLWLIINPGKLCSIAHFHIWKPGATETGDLNEVVYNNWFHKIYGGVYAYKLDQEYQLYLDTLELASNIYHWESYLTKGIMGIATGTIKMWGEVVEHEKGYRAQFAKVQTVGIAELRPGFSIEEIMRNLQEYIP